MKHEEKFPLRWWVEMGLTAVLTSFLLLNAAFLQHAIEGKVDWASFSWAWMYLVVGVSGSRAVYRAWHYHGFSRE